MPKVNKIKRFSLHFGIVQVLPGRSDKGEMYFLRGRCGLFEDC